DNVAITTNGVAARGVEAIGDASVTMTGGSITTVGNRAIGVRASMGGTATITLTDDEAISTMGQNAHGISTADNAAVSMTGGDISTTGSNARGVNAVNQSVVTLAGVDIDTS